MFFLIISRVNIRHSQINGRILWLDNYWLCPWVNRTLPRARFQNGSKNHKNQAVLKLLWIIHPEGYVQAYYSSKAWLSRMDWGIYVCRIRLFLRKLKPASWFFDFAYFFHISHPWPENLRLLSSPIGWTSPAGLTVYIPGTRHESIQIGFAIKFAKFSASNIIKKELYVQDICC